MDDGDGDGDGDASTVVSSQVSASQQPDTPSLDLSSLPPIYISSTHLDQDPLHEIEGDVTAAGGLLTYDLKEANIVLSKVPKKARIQFDLRAKGCWTEDIGPFSQTVSTRTNASPSMTSNAWREKRKRAAEGHHAGDAINLDDESTASETEDGQGQDEASKVEPPLLPLPTPGLPANVIIVLKLEWLERSKEAGTPLPFEDFLSFRGRRIDPPQEQSQLKGNPVTDVKPLSTPPYPLPRTRPAIDESILKRAKEDVQTNIPSRNGHGKRKFGQKTTLTFNAPWTAGHGSIIQYAHLMHTTTSEYDDGESSDLPEAPEWVKKGIKYACQRLTPRSSPNDAFIDLLKKVRVARELTNDEIGVRAYSTSIAALAAYPCKLSNPKEILRLPGCDVKIANLFVEWSNTGRIRAVDEIDANEEIKVLRSFYDIWGVGAATAIDFYYERGWRDMDDIIEFGWNTLSRVQQIGVKYYDEFLDPIPRAEVEEIGRIIHRHACKVRDDEIQSLLVGGYRRGKEACGDVDIVVSHPEESKTLNIVSDIVASLEEEEWITHTLLLSLNGTKRNQQTLPFRTGGGGHGFDTLDKALVVWQNPQWPTKAADLAAADRDGSKLRNTNIHRRVDIIVSPWRTVGCAVAGWSGGTTFQRDLRRYAKHTRGWKFDSSGVRDRTNGQVVDLEGWNGANGKAGRAKSMDEAERRVFEGMGLDFIVPWERCTG